MLARAMNDLFDHLTRRDASSSGKLGGVTRAASAEVLARLSTRDETVGRASCTRSRRSRRGRPHAIQRGRARRDRLQANRGEPRRDFFRRYVCMPCLAWRNIRSGGGDLGFRTKALRQVIPDILSRADLACCESPDVCHSRSRSAKKMHGDEDGLPNTLSRGDLACCELPGVCESALLPAVPPFPFTPERAEVSTGVSKGERPWQLTFRALSPQAWLSPALALR